jgi:hypothetical protein
VLASRAGLPRLPQQALWSLVGRRRPSLVQDEDMEHTGVWTHWVGYSSGPGGKDHLPPEVRAEVDRRDRLRKERRGRLLCEVHVQVYEHDAGDAAMGVVFPSGAALGPESDPAEVAAAVARAREQLGRWR